MTLPHPLCLLSVIWNALRGYLTVGARIGGHQLAEQSRLSNCIVTVLKCERCGSVSVGWETTAQSTYAPYPDEKESAA